MLTLFGLRCIWTVYNRQRRFTRGFLAPLLPRQNQEPKHLTLLVSLTYQTNSTKTSDQGFLQQINFLGFLFCFSDVTSWNANLVLKEVCEDCISPSLPKLECYSHAFSTKLDKSFISEYTMRGDDDTPPPGPQGYTRRQLHYPKGCHSF